MSRGRDLQELINERVEEFVADITQLAREHAIETLANALDLTPERSGRRRRSGAKKTGGNGRHKRSRVELERLTASLGDYIRDNPGEKMQDIAAELGVTAKQLSLPARKLAADSQIRTEGQRRATRYFPAGRARRK